MMSQATFYKWSDLPETALTPDIKRRMITGEKVMVLNLTLAKGAIVGQHHHPHEQVSFVLSGALEFEINGEKQRVQGGEGVILPSNIPHAVVALEDTHVLDIFSPPREDFLSDEPPAYMKEKP
jgi:quercetin dioxygenase-like cupin family protein